jgi:uncharacterized membrane protein YjjP (DUF1212 family)
MRGTPDPATVCEEPEASHAVNVCVLLGRMLFNFGATTKRIQDSIGYLARHLGCKVDMLVSYDALLITVNDGETLRTRIDSTRRFAGLNLIGLVRVSEWLRGLPGSQFSPAELERTLSEIRDAPPVHGTAAHLLAAGCAGAGFCIVNGGDPVSWACTFVVGAFVFAFRRLLLARSVNFHLTIVAIALAGSLLAGLLARITKTSTPEAALLAPLLFLVPGVPMIIGGIDVVWNHVTIGLARIGFTLAVLVGLSLGVGLTLAMLGSRSHLPYSLGGVREILLFSFAGALASGALACLNNGDHRLIALCALGGMTGRLVRALVSLAGLDLITASLIGVICSTLIVSCFIASRLGWSAVVAAVMAALPMVPGYFAIDGLHSLVAFSAAGAADPAQLSVALHALSRATFISAALVVGVIGPLTILRRDKDLV